MKNWNHNNIVCIKNDIIIIRAKRSIKLDRYNIVLIIRHAGGVRRVNQMVWTRLKVKFQQLIFIIYIVNSLTRFEYIYTISLSGLWKTANNPLVYIYVHVILYRKYNRPIFFFLKKKTHFSRLRDSMHEIMQGIFWLLLVVHVDTQ